MELQTSGMGQFCFLLHQYILGMVAVWTLVINTFLRKEELRKCEYISIFSNLWSSGCLIIFFTVTFETLRDLKRDLFSRPTGQILPL